MSLVTIIKDYFEIVHKVLETSPGYIVEHTTYTDFTTLYFYLINTFKNLFSDLFSLDFLQRITSFPIIVPNITESMISEISVLDGNFHNLFTFLDSPLVTIRNNSIVIVCLEKFFVGLFNSLFLWLPTSAATFLCLRRFVMQGIEIGYIAAIGTMTANIFWLICVLFGIRCIVIPWMSLDILRYWLGFILLIKYFWDNRLPAKEIQSDISSNILKNQLGLKSILAVFAQIFQFHKNNSIKQIFLFHFLLAFTEQTTVYPFISNFSLSAQSTYLESFSSNNFPSFLIIHCFYLLGIFIGSFSLINFVCWFWEEPVYKVYLWTTKNFQQIRVGDMVRITHFLFQTLTIILACASLPYFSIEYFITKPLGFLPNDQIFHQSKNSVFLTHSTSPILYRSPYFFPRQRFFRYDDWAEYYGKNIPLDTSLYDQGAYRLYPIEDLHFGADYEWTRRRSNHVKIRSRMKRIMWFPRNWATQIWDLAKTWSRRNVAWRNEILSQYQNNWDSKSAPFWEQILREDLLFEMEKSKKETTTKRNSPWAASPNWSQKFLISGESFWWNWWSKNTNSDNKIWWNWVLTKKKEIIINNKNQVDSYQHNFLTSHFSNSFNREEKNKKSVQQDLVFSNYQKLPSSYRFDYWLPQERLISLYSEQSKKQKNQLVYEIATLRKLVRKIKKRVQINLNREKNPSYLNTIISLKNRKSYSKYFSFLNSLDSLITNIKNKLIKYQFFGYQSYLLNNEKDQLTNNYDLNSLVTNYRSITHSSIFNKNPSRIYENSKGLFYDTTNRDNLYSTNLIKLEPNNENFIPTNKQKTVNLPKKKNLFINQSDQDVTNFSSFFLTLPVEYYLQTEQSFSRKLQFYGVRNSREFKSLNNSPLFNYYMKTYFHQYKPTRLYIETTKMKRDLGAGGRNRFKSRQYANKQLKKARILSKTPWIRQWISQSGFLTRRKRLESWIRYSHYTSNEIWGFILRADIDNFIKRQPNSHLLTNNEERLLHLRRFLLGEHFETLRWYSFMQHYRSMKVKIGGTKSFVNRIYNQQFKGTFHKIRHLFALTPSLNGGGILTFDQLLYNEFPNDNKNTIFNQELIHEELLSDTKKNLNFFLVKEKKTENLNVHLSSNDLIIKFSDILKNYLLKNINNRQQSIQKLLKDKNFIDLTILLKSVTNNKDFNKYFLINEISNRKDFRQNENHGLTNQQRIISLLDVKEKGTHRSFWIHEQKKFQSMLIFNKRSFLAKDYKRGSERLWKNWRKKYLIQKQLQKRSQISNLKNAENLIFLDNIFKKFDPIEKKSLPIYRTNNSQKSDFDYLYYKNLLKTNQKNSGTFSYQKHSIIRKALRDSILIQKEFFNKYALEAKIKNRNFPLIIANLNTKIESINKLTDQINENVETMIDFRKNHLESKLLNIDRNVIKEFIRKICKKKRILNIYQLRYFIPEYWSEGTENWFNNLNKKKWHLLSANNKELKAFLKSKNQIHTDMISNQTKKEKNIFHILSYIQNKTIRQRLDINKQILNLTNYNQIDSKFFIVRTSRHLKRARISRRQILSLLPFQNQKYTNFFHIEKENLKKLNVFKTYQTSHPHVLNFFKMSQLQQKPSKKNQALQNINSLLNYELNNKNNNIFEFSNHSTLFNIFQPFIEFLYFLPRLSTLWQSNLININIEPKIDMGTIYETKQNFPPTGIQKQLFRQNFNTKNHYQDNIKRKLLDNHLNRFSKRRRWNNKYQRVNTQRKRQIKKFLQIINQNNQVFLKNKKIFNKYLLFDKEKTEQKSVQSRNEKTLKDLILFFTILEKKILEKKSLAKTEIITYELRELNRLLAPLRKLDSRIQNLQDQHIKPIENKIRELKRQEQNVTANTSAHYKYVLAKLEKRKNQIFDFKQKSKPMIGIQKRGTEHSQKDNYYKKMVTIQKRGTEYSQKNSYYKKYKHKWNTNKSHKFAGLTTDGQKGISNLIGLRTWKRAKQHFNVTSTSINQKLLKFSFNSFLKPENPEKFLSIEMFIKESILKPQRLEKLLSSKKIKFKNKKLSRQGHFKNLQFWDNFFKQKEDIKNNLFFDDLSLSFRKWKNFGFYEQKKMYQKQRNNFYTFFSLRDISSRLISKEKNKKFIKFSNFDEKNLKIITNLDIIKQIEYDNLIQKELNRILTQEFNKVNINSTIFNNDIIFKKKNKYNHPFVENNTNLNSLQEFYASESKTNEQQIINSNKDIIGNIYEKLFIQPIQTKINQKETNKKLLIGINTFPFYAGWDESLRKFVITNRLLSRREAGFNTKQLFKEEQMDVNYNKSNIDFQKWPLYGKNAATSFFCHFPFITQPTDFLYNIQYKNRTEFQQEEQNPLSAFQKESGKQNLSLNRIKKQKQDFRNESRRNITNIIGLNEIQNRRKTIFFPLKWRDLKYNTNQIILKLPKNKIQRDLSLSNYHKKADPSSSNNLLSKFHLLRILRKGNTSKLRLTKLKQYKKSIKKKNERIVSPWRTFLSKRKLRSYNFVRQKNIQTMHFLKYELGKKLETTKLQWLFRKNNSRTNRQSENRKKKSGGHYLRPKKKSLRKRSLGIKYKKNEGISSFQNFDINKLNLSKSSEINDFSISQINLNQNRIQINKKMRELSIKDSYRTNLHELKITKENGNPEHKTQFYETPLNWIGPKTSTNLYQILFKIPSIYTPTIYSTLPGHSRFLPKMQTMSLPKSSVQTIQRAVRLANFEPTSFIQREILSYQWSMKQLIRNMTSRLNSSFNRLKTNNINKNNKLILGPAPSASFSIDFIIQRHLRFFKKKLINNPILDSSSNLFLSQFSRHRTFQKRSIRLRKFNITLAMNLYDRWFFYYYTGGREDPLQNLFQNFGKLANNLSNPNTIQINQSQIDDKTKSGLNNINKFKKNFIFKSIRKFLTQKPDQKRSFNTFLTNLKTKKAFSNMFEISNKQEKQNIFYSTNLNQSDFKNENFKTKTQYNPNSVFLDQWWHLFQLFPQRINEPSLQKQKELLVKSSTNKKQTKQQEKDLEEDRFYFLKANKSPIIQDFRSNQNVNRHYPLNGGFIWPGDYLRLQTVMLPKEKKFQYIYNKNLLPELQNSIESKNKSLPTSISMIYSNYKIKDKIKEFQDYILESKVVK